MFFALNNLGLVLQPALFKVPQNNWLRKLSAEIFTISYNPKSIYSKETYIGNIRH